MLLVRPTGDKRIQQSRSFNVREVLKIFKERFRGSLIVDGRPKKLIHGSQRRVESHSLRDLGYLGSISLKLL